MWVIIVSNDLKEFRNNILDEIVNNNVSDEKYLTYGNNRWHETSFFPNAKIWKTKSRAEKQINAFKQSIDYNYKYSLIKGKHLAAKKIDKYKWNEQINWKLSKLEMIYRAKRQKLETKIIL
jgi:hypothetical protein